MATSFRSDVADAINEKNPDAGITETSSAQAFSEAIHSIQTGISYKRKLTGDDLNTLTEDGIYDFTSGDGNVPINRPSDATKRPGMVWVETSPVNNFIMQTYCEFNLTNHLWTRVCIGDWWFDWEKLAVETNASAQSLLKKTPVSGDAVTDADGIFGTHNGNFVTRTMAKLWEWICTHLEIGIPNDITVDSNGPQLLLKNTKNTTNGYTRLFKARSDTFDAGTDIVDLTNGVTTTLHLEGGYARVAGSEILTIGSLFRNFPNIMRGGLIYPYDSFERIIYNTSDYEPDDTYFTADAMNSVLLVVGSGGAAVWNHAMRDWRPDDYFYAGLVYRADIEYKSGSDTHFGTNFVKVDLGSRGNVARFAINTVTETATVAPDVFIRIPKGSWASVKIYRLMG